MSELLGSVGKGAAEAQRVQPVRQGVDALTVRHRTCRIGPHNVEPGVYVRNGQPVQRRVGERQGCEVIGVRDLRSETSVVRRQQQQWRVREQNSSHLFDNESDNVDREL